MANIQNKKLAVFYSLVICILVTSSANAKDGWQFFACSKSFNFTKFVWMVVGIFCDAKYVLGWVFSSSGFIGFTYCIFL